MDRNNQELLVFLEILKSNRNTITFDHNILHSSISFLDKLISKGWKNTLQTSLYQKPTNQQSYLHAHSNLLKSLKEAYRVANI